MGRVLATLVGFLGDIELAEDAAQEAFAIAAERWPRDGEPDQPDRLADHDRAQPRDRPDPPPADARRKTELLPRELRDPPEDTMDEPRPSPTSGSS